MGIAPTGGAVHSAQTPIPLKTGVSGQCPPAQLLRVPPLPAQLRAASRRGCSLPSPQLKGSLSSTQSEMPGSGGRALGGAGLGCAGLRVLLEVLSAE